MGGGDSGSRRQAAELNRWRPNFFANPVGDANLLDESDPKRPDIVSPFYDTKIVAGGPGRQASVAASRVTGS